MAIASYTFFQNIWSAGQALLRTPAAERPAPYGHEDTADPRRESLPKEHPGPERSAPRGLEGTAGLRWESLPKEHPALERSALRGHEDTADPRRESLPPEPPVPERSAPYGREITRSTRRELLSPELLRRLLPRTAPELPPVVLCIGTDRMIGDCLGPFSGTLLERAAGGRLPVYGTLANTVHALNLSDVSAAIKKKHPGRTVIAVDASLGPQAHIGSVFVRPGSLAPGAGVHKKLPSAGDIAITGIVGAAGSRPYLDLQTVRLSTVAAMAEEICACILEVCI